MVDTFTSVGFPVVEIVVAIVVVSIVVVPNYMDDIISSVYNSLTCKTVSLRACTKLMPI